VPGASPLRFVLDSTLRLPLDAKVLEPDAGTTILTTDRAGADRRRALAERRVGVELLPAGPQGVDLPAALAALLRAGVATLLVEGGARVITSLLAGALVDRMIVSVAPTIIGQGTEAVGPLGITSVADGLRLSNRSTHLVGEDVVIAGDVRPPSQGSPA
jgi:riboflavin-specific deaminase-like protein